MARALRRSHAVVAISLAVSSATVLLAQSSPPTPAAPRPIAGRIGRRTPPVDGRLGFPNANPNDLRPVAPDVGNPNAAANARAAKSTSRPDLPELAYLAPLTERLIANRTNSVQTLEMLVVAGDIDGAERLLSTWIGGTFRAFGSGLLAAYSGSSTFETVSRLYGGPPERDFDHDVVKGLLTGAARRGDQAGAESALKLARASERTELQARLARMLPTPPNLDAIAKLDPRASSPEVVRDRAIALAAAGDEAKVNAFFDELARIGGDRVAGGGLGKTPDFTSLRAAAARAYLRAGKFEAAAAVAKLIPVIPGKDWWVDELRAAFLVPSAVAGDTAPIERAMEQAQADPAPSLTGLGRMEDLHIYALAKSGSVEEAKQLARTTHLFAGRQDNVSFRLGLIAKAQAEGGKQDEARQTIEEALAAIAKLKNREGREAAAIDLMRAAVLGAETYAYSYDLGDMW